MTDLPAMLYTIGHSTHAIEHFLGLLRQHGVTAVGDVRSQPHSRYNPQFNREVLKRSLERAAIAYVYLGEELGARSADAECYEDNQVQFDRLARTALFQRGITRVREGMKVYRIALMCAEKEPIECHRTILVSRHFEAAGIPVTHILADGSVETHEEAMGRVLRLLKLPETDMFRSRAELVEDAYRAQARRIAYEKKGAGAGR